MKLFISIAILMSVTISHQSVYADALQSVISEQNKTVVINLDGQKMQTREDLFAKIQVSLGLDSSFGSNLDALYDVLSERTELTIIVLQNQKNLKRSLGEDYYKAFVETIIDASLVNSHIKLNKQK